MHLTRPRKPRRRRGLLAELLETRTLFHAGTFALANGVLNIAPDHGNNTILVQWDPASRSVGVFANGQQQLRVPGSEVRGLNMRGLQGNDLALIDTRLPLLVSYDRGGDQGVLRTQLDGSGDGDDYCVATPGCVEFAFTSGTAQRPNPIGSDAATVQALAGIHAGHPMMVDGGMGPNGDGASALPGDTGAASMNHRLYVESPYLHGGAAGLDSMLTMDYAVKRGAVPKWMPPG